MANEFQLDLAAYTGLNLYFVQFDAETTGQAWNGSAYATYTSTRDTFDIAFTEVSGTGLFRGSIGGTARYLRLSVYIQSGGSPSFATDVQVAGGRYYWDGTLLVEQGPVDATKIAGSTAAATKLASSADTMIIGTVNDANFTPTTTQFRVTGITDAEEDQYADRRILVLSGDLIRQVSSISASELISGETHLTLSKALTQALSDGDTVLVV